MFHRLTLRASDREASQRFYDIVLPTLGISGWTDFAIVAGDGVTRRLHIGFVASSRAHVDEFWRTGTAAGYRDDGAPGPRPQYRDDYYGAFLLDPDGNSAEAVHHGALRRGGLVDHLWIRVANVAASKRFYESVAARAGLRLAEDTPDLVRFAGESGSFTLLSGTPTEHVSMALAAESAAELVDPDGNVARLVPTGC